MPLQGEYETLPNRYPATTPPGRGCELRGSSNWCYMRQSHRREGKGGTVMEPTRQAGIEHRAAHTAAAPAPGRPSAGSNKKGESRIKSWKVGDVKITSIMETADRIPWAPLFPAETSEHYKKYAWLGPNFVM